MNIEENKKTMKDIVEEFVRRFNQKNLTVKKFISLSVSETRFHLFGTWNEVRAEEGFFKHFKMETGGNMLQVGSLEINKAGSVFYLPYEDSFIIFKQDRKRGLLIPEYVYTKLSMFSPVDEKRKFLHEKGFKIYRRVLNPNLHSRNPYIEVDVF